MRFAAVTVFPEMFAAVTGAGISGRAVRAGLVEVTTWNPRDHAGDRHATVDDRPYGGGPGMVMMVEPLRAAIGAACTHLPLAKVVYLSPQGRPLTQARLAAMAGERELVLVCGRYEGVDERLLALEVDEELSLGDFVLSGGELAAMAVIDGVTRLLPGVLGCEHSAMEDSFADGLLDCPHYTRPETVAGLEVPAVLLTGHHGNITRWRLKQALGRTHERRPDLLRSRGVSDAERALLDEYLAERAGEPEHVATTDDRKTKS